MRNKFTRWDYFWVAMLLLAGGHLLFRHYYNNTTYTQKQIDEMFAPITSKYGIKIVYEIGDDFLSETVNPAKPAGPYPSSKVKPIRHRRLARYPKILQNAFDKYPDQVIKTYLKAVYFAGEIDQNGFKYGGSYDPFRQIIFFVDNGRQTKNISLNVFHHEFSSLLLNKNAFPIYSWQNCNPRNYKYLYETTKDMLSTFNSTSSIGAEDDYKKGFMNSYGQTELENDFNAYSGMIFTSPEKFKKIMNQYPRVRCKFKVWLAFYHQIDPMFTEEYLLGAHQQDRADAGMD